jgi:hypothetical protein
MHAKLGQPMPMSTYEKQALDNAVVRFWEEPIKYWDATLVIENNCQGWLNKHR